MDYKYKFEMNKCWYRNVCQHYNDGGKICNASCPRYMEVHYLFSTSNLPERYWQPFILTPEDCDYEAYIKLNNIKRSMLDFTKSGKSLYIFSAQMGNGKTSWAIKLLQSYFNEIWLGNCLRERATFIHVPTFLRQVTESVQGRVSEDFLNLKERLMNDDLVVWDDIASTNLSAFDHKYLLSFIDQRILQGKSNIYTGNLDFVSLSEAIGARLTSRVYNDSIVVEFKGQDRRGM